jgi:hypothetical protein
MIVLTLNKILLNGSRLGEILRGFCVRHLWYLTGFYEPVRRNINRAFGLSPTEQVPVTSLMAGAASGAVGGEFHCATPLLQPLHLFSLASIGNPLFLIKARMQVSRKYLPVSLQTISILIQGLLSRPSGWGTTSLQAFIWRIGNYISGWKVSRINTGHGCCHPSYVNGIFREWSFIARTFSIYHMYTDRSNCQATTLRKIRLLRMACCRRIVYGPILPAAPYPGYVLYVLLLWTKGTYFDLAAVFSNATGRYC